MNRCMDGWISGYMHGWTDTEILDRWMDTWMHGWINRYGWIDDEWTHARMDRYMDTWMDG